MRNYVSIYQGASRNYEDGKVDKYGHEVPDQIYLAFAVKRSRWFALQESLSTLI